MGVVRYFRVYARKLDAFGCTNLGEILHAGRLTLYTIHGYVGAISRTVSSRLDGTHNRWKKISLVGSETHATFIQGSRSFRFRRKVSVSNAKLDRSVRG